MNYLEIMEELKRLAFNLMSDSKDPEAEVAYIFGRVDRKSSEIRIVSTDKDGKLSEVTGNNEKLN